MTIELRQHYLDYLTALNEHRFDDLITFVADDLTYNDRPMTRAQYQHERADEAELIPDLRFTPALLVVDDDQVACRLDFDCTPVGPFHGFDVSGQRIQFAEHVFYRFRDGRISAVTSLHDVAAIERQSLRGGRSRPQAG